MTNGKFKAGDIIFFYSDGSFQDYFIRLVSPKYTHMGMFINDTEFIEASAQGVKISQFDTKFNADIYRVRGLTELQINSGIALATTHLGEKYSFTQAILAGIFRILKLTELADKIDQNWFCSEFVAYIIRKGFDINICPKLAEQNILPVDLVKSPYLQEIYLSSFLGLY